MVGAGDGVAADDAGCGAVEAAANGRRDRGVCGADGPQEQDGLRGAHDRAVAVSTGPCTNTMPRDILLSWLGAGQKTAA